ncbi:TPA: hypothetical protein ACS72I_001681 [Providencia alcalifaciens]
MSEISHLATDKDIASMLLDLSNIVSVILGGAIGFTAKYFLEFKRMKEDKKALRQQMITNNIAPMRQEWINDLRTNLSNFLYISKRVNNHISFYVTRHMEINPSSPEEVPDSLKESEKQIEKDVLKINEIFTYVNLLLPFASKTKMEYDAELLRKCMMIMCQSYMNVFIDKPNIPTHIKVIIKVEPYCQRYVKKVLKKEWDETKSLKEIE